MQCLASLSVGLHLDQLLCNPPVPPHHQDCPPDSAAWSPSEWAWLECFSTTVKAAEALAKGAPFPESFTVPDLEPVPEDEFALLLVRFSRINISTYLDGWKMKSLPNNSICSCCTVPVEYTVMGYLKYQIHEIHISLSNERRLLSVRCKVPHSKVYKTRSRSIVCDCCWSALYFYL